MRDLSVKFFTRKNFKKGRVARSGFAGIETPSYLSPGGDASRNAALSRETTSSKVRTGRTCPCSSCRSAYSTEASGASGILREGLGR
jgi:hypothetical protein